MSEIDIKLNVCLTENWIEADVEVFSQNVNVCVGGGISYAFYLFKNGVRIETLWYSQNNKARFDLNETGAYKVACFVKSRIQAILQ